MEKFDEIFTVEKTTLHAAGRNADPEKLLADLQSKERFTDVEPIDGYLPLALYHNEFGYKPGTGIGIPEIDRIVTFAPGYFYVFSGDPGSGKSEFLDHILTLLSIREDWKFLVFSPENPDTPFHINKLISKITGKEPGKGANRDEVVEAFNHVVSHFAFISRLRDTTVENLLAVAEKEYSLRPYEMMVLDPFNYIRSSIDASVGEAAATLDVLTKLAEFAKEKRIRIFLVAHPTKSGSTARRKNERPTLYDIRGTADFNNVTDVGLWLSRDRETGVVSLETLKIRNKYIGKEDKIELEYDINNGRYYSRSTPQFFRTSPPNILRTLAPK